MYKNIPLTASEIGNLWTSYMNNSMALCIIGFMLKHIEDEEVRPIIQFSYDISSSHMKQLHRIFEQDEYAVPEGFSPEKDVNMDAPWLFSDTFCLTYVNHMAKVGMATYGGLLAMSKRMDVRELFTSHLNETIALYNQSTECAAEKGLLATHPYIEVPKESDQIDTKRYFSGLNPFTNKRPLNAVEISHLFINIQNNSIGVYLSLAFGQTSPLKEVQEYMIRGKDIANKHIQIFTDRLLEGDIPNPRLADVSVSDSTTQTFSDKFQMFQMSLLSGAGTGNYALAASASQRSDLVIDYERLSLEIGKFAKSGADIMIKHNWLEQPPGTKDREKLVREKKG